jgi:predicted dehydrogenase
MSQIRLGVIGCGGMGQSHMGVFKENPKIKFTAASDSFQSNLDKVVSTYGVKGFTDGYELIKSGLVDAVLVATPHYFHPPYAIAAIQAGVHVLVEKPVSVTAKAAAEVDVVARANPHVKYAVNYQNRSLSRWSKVRQMIQAGAIGKIQRVHWTITTWYRTQAYYDSGSWRATWEGEGGGVLLNQCPHNLDLLCWLVGPPKRVTARIGVAKYHKIQVEDEVIAILDYDNGAMGTFVTTTGEAPGTDYFEIVGDKGKITLSPQTLGPLTIEWVSNEVSAIEFGRTTKATWATPPNCKHVITVPDTGGGVKAMHANFANAILEGEPLIAPGIEGIHSVEMANAMIMSGLENRPIDLPMDREAYETLLQGLIAKHKK